MTCLEALLDVISTALFLSHNDHVTYLCNPRLRLLLYYLPSIPLVTPYRRQKILHLFTTVGRQLCPGLLYL